MVRPDWIAVDWGTSRLRAWAMAADGAVLAEGSSADGMGALDVDGFEPALMRLVGDWLPDTGAPVPVLACGMVGARQGWREAPYRTVPCAPLGGGMAATTADPRLLVRILPGLAQTTPPDVMRGEETQIAGLLSHMADFDGVICLPGTHTKWAQVSAGEVVSFQTFLTGEMFDLLATRSVLRHSVGGGALDRAAFAGAVTDAMTAPQKLAARLFAIRAAGLLEGLPEAEARGRLSGLLIGLELAGAKPYWLGQNVAVIGAPDLAGLYAEALKGAGVTVAVLEATSMTLAGLGAARRGRGDA